MKNFKIEATGNLPTHIKELIVDRYTPLIANRDTINSLDSDIEFIVCDIKDSHGNLNKFDKSAWLSPRNNDGSWNIRISF